MAPGQARAGRDPVPRTPEGRRSMPIRYLPVPALSRDVSQSLTNRVKCLIYDTGVAERGAAPLGHVRLPAAVPAEGARRDTHQGTRRQAEAARSEEHTSELQSLTNLVCRLLLEKT